METQLCEYKPLFRHLHVDKLHCVLDPMAGTGTTAVAFQNQVTQVITNDINAAHNCRYQLDVSQRSTWLHFRQHHNIDAVICSPWFSIADIALAYAVHFYPIVLFHVPQNYVMGAPRHRRQWFQHLQDTSRYLCIAGVKGGKQGFACLWICIFKTAELRLQFMRQPHKDCCLLFA